MDDRFVGMDRVDYSRQAALDESIAAQRGHSERVIIIGCGGIGFYAGLFMAMMGMKEFILIDGQTIDNTNLNRLPVPQSWIGLNKAIALKKLIRLLRPLTAVTVIRSHILEEDEGILQELMRAKITDVIDTTDDARIQAKIYGWLREHGRADRYVKMGYDGMNVGAYKTFNVWLPEEYVPGYTTSNANAITSALAAGLGLFKLFLGNQEDMNINLSELVGQRPSEDEDDEAERDPDLQEPAFPPTGR